MGNLLEILEMVRSKLLLLFHDVINFLMECQQVLVDDSLSLVICEGHAQVIHFSLAMLGSLSEGAGARAWIPGSGRPASHVASRTRVRPFLGSHRGWVLGWPSTDSLGSSCVVPWTDVTRSRGYWVLGSSPASTFSLLSLQVILAALPLIGYVLVDSGERVR